MIKIYTQFRQSVLLGANEETMVLNNSVSVLPATATSSSSSINTIKKCYDDGDDVNDDVDDVDDDIIDDDGEEICGQQRTNHHGDKNNAHTSSSNASSVRAFSSNAPSCQPAGLFASIYTVPSSTPPIFASYIPINRKMISESLEEPASKVDLLEMDHLGDLSELKDPTCLARTDFVKLFSRFASFSFSTLSSSSSKRSTTAATGHQTTSRSCTTGSRDLADDVSVCSCLAHQLRFASKSATVTYSGGDTALMEAKLTTPPCARLAPVTNKFVSLITDMDQDWDQYCGCGSVSPYFYHS